MRLRDRVALSIGAFRLSAANPRLRLVQLARLTSVTGRWAYTITLAVYAYQTAGAGGAAVAGIVRLVPAAAFAPFAGTLIRRIPATRLLAGGGFVRTAARATAGWVVMMDGPSAAVYLLVAVETVVSTL